MMENATMRPRNDDAAREDRTFGIAGVIGTLRRRWRFVAVGCVSGLIIAISYIMLATPLYTSTARVLIDTRMNQNLQMQKLVGDTVVDTALVDSQGQIITSESIILPIVKSMNLIHDKEFVGPPDGLGAQVLLQIKKFIGSIKHLFVSNDNSTVDAGTLLERDAVETFLSRLTAKREELTYVIDVSFASEDPSKAARIANAVAGAYIAANLEAKTNSSKLASRWLQDRLIELKAQATESDQALQDYKTANNLVSTGRGLLNNEQLSDLNTQLMNARTATAEAKARLDRIEQITKEGIPDATVTDSLNNSVITRLRAQYLDLAARAADLTARVGKEHATVLKLHQQMDELRKSIRSEEQRIADAYASDYEIAKAREHLLANTMSQLVREAGTSSQAQVTMRNLESSAETYRNLYNTFLQKFQETIQTQTIPVTDARIITMATTPLRKSAPKSTLALAGGILLGLFLGAGTAIARELTTHVFRTPNEVEQTTRIQCLGVLPNIAANRAQPSWFRGGTKPRLNTPVSNECIEEFALDAPHSRFTETLRNLKALINAAQLMRDIKVIGVVSSVAKEGKTTLVANLAALMVASSKAKTLVIDGDPHRRSLTAKLAPDAREGLIEALADPSRLATLVYKRQRSQLDVLPCVLEGRIPNAAELIGSPQMQELLAAARKAYDYIIIELAPVMCVVDVKVIERFVDSFIFVVEWGRSNQSLVVEALAEAQVIRERIIGIVLNKADPVALRSYEAYKGERFSSYYQG
jgi:succinoglycan biosynthesis transport protein ExoP